MFGQWSHTRRRTFRLVSTQHIEHRVIQGLVYPMHASWNVDINRNWPYSRTTELLVGVLFRNLRMLRVFRPSKLEDAA